MLKLLTAGESHGPSLTAILDGMPARIPLSEKDISSELSKRQMGEGRGGRMKIESDRAQITAGVRLGLTLGSPIAISIPNKAREKWEEPFTKLRPGHADLAGAMKYGQRDLRDILERASARETAARVAAGAVCKKFLSQFEIKVTSSVVHIGGLPGKSPKIELRKLIEKTREEGDTLGGVFEMKALGLPPGLGSFMQWDRRLDGILAQALMSIPAVKGVEIGLGFEGARMKGSQVHDEIFYERKSFIRKTNNSGGLEGGVTNGEPLVLRAAMKPISTLVKPLRSVDLKTKKPAMAHVERADVCAVEAAAVIGGAMAAFVLAQAMLDKFGGDSLDEVRDNLSSFKKRLAVL